MPTFAHFYRAVNRRDPFPWQQRLAEQVASSGQWPEEVGVPTGLGKTACLDIAVWWLALQADCEPALRVAPTRIYWVVNRRLLVDSTADHAESVAALLQDPSRAGLTGDEKDIIANAAVRLRSLSADPDAPPLEVIRLRGGVASRTPRDPSQPAVVLCTLPMFGSRLLFRGFGSGQRMRAVDAAMAGIDSLVLVDEAHLAPHLITLISALPACYPDALPIPNVTRSRPRVVALTATGNVGADARFTLDDSDAAHAIVRTRLNARKSLELRVDAGDSAKALAEAALDMIRSAPKPTTCLVFANTPKVARSTFGFLKKDISIDKASVLLLTGLSREREAARVRAKVLDGMGVSRSATVPRQRHLIVVATQTLEVGADIDAEFLATEACGVRALTQRLGRLNRLGRYGQSHAIYVHLPPPKRSSKSPTKNSKDDFWPVYGTEPGYVLERLQQATNSSGVVDLSPGRVAQVLGEPKDSPGRAPEVLRGILWEWIKTSIRPAGQAPVEPYFSGITGAQRRISLIWRAHVPNTGERLWPRCTDKEAIDVRIGEVRSALNEQEAKLCKLQPDGVTVESVTPGNLRTGNKIILPIDCGLLDEFGWNPDASGPVMDVSLLHRGLPLSTKAIERLCGLNLALAINKALQTDRDEDFDQREQAEAVGEILRAVQSVEAPSGWDDDEWADFTSSLSSEAVHPRNQVPRLKIEKPVPEPVSSDFDETSLAIGGAAATLESHGCDVGVRAQGIARCLGLEPIVTDVIKEAGTFHDIGKADRRFQRWLDPRGRSGSLLAKSNVPHHLWESRRGRAGWSRGGRHEALSARLAQAWLDENPDWYDSACRDLLLHLVISHHGKGRPLVQPVRDGTVGTVSAEIYGVKITVRADLQIIDWNQPARFRRLNERFGPWGLALLESIVIRADHATSGAT